MTEGSRRLEVRALEVVLKGGSPWGFSLKGGAEIRSALTVSKVEPDGKANGLLEAGDILLSINDVHCRSRAEAIQLVKSAFNTLTLTVWRTSTSSNSPCSAPNEGMFSVVVVGGSVESSASSPSPSFLKKAQEIKDKERNKEKDSKENIPAPIEEETTKRNSIEVQVRSPSSRSRVRPRSWHPVGGDGDTAKLTLSPLDDSSFNELSSPTARTQGTAHDSPFTSPTRTLAELKESAAEAENTPSNNNVNKSNNSKTLNTYHSAYNLSDYPEEAQSSANFTNKDSDVMKGTNRRSYGGMPTRTMHTAYSTPNLDKEEADRSRLSMYNALNTRSGYKFLPTKQQQQGPWESSVGSWDTRPFEASPQYGGFQDSPPRQISHSIQCTRGPNYRRSNNDYENFYRTEYHIDVDHSRHPEPQEQPPEIPPPPREEDLVDSSSQQQSPPMPPVRDASSLKYFKASHNMDSSLQQWTAPSVSSPVEGKPPESPGYVSAPRTNNAWSEQTGTTNNNDFSKRSRGVLSRSYDSTLNPAFSDVSNRLSHDRGYEDVVKSPQELEMRAGNVHRATVAKVHTVEEDRKLNSTFPMDSKSSNSMEIQTDYSEYQSSSTYPGGRMGRGYEDEDDYSAPSSQRDVIVKQNGETQTEPQEERKSFSDLVARFEGQKGGSRGSGSMEARRTVVKSASTSTIGSQRSQQVNSPLNESDSYTYIVRNKPYYNTSTQTDDLDTPVTERQLQQPHAPSVNNKMSSSKSESSIKKHAEVQVDTDFTGVYHAQPVMSSSGTQVDPESPTLKTTQATTSTHTTAPAGTSGHGAIYHENEPYRRIQAWMQHAENHKLSDVSSGYKSDDGASRLAKSMTDIADEDHYEDKHDDHIPSQEEDQVNSDSTLVNSKVEADEPKSSDNDNETQVIPYHSYSDSTAPMLRKLSAEMYKQQIKEQQQYDQLQQEQEQQQEEEIKQQEQEKLLEEQQQDTLKYFQQPPADVTASQVQKQKLQDEPNVQGNENQFDNWQNVDMKESENNYKEDNAKEVSDTPTQQHTQQNTNNSDMETTPVAPKRKKREERLRMKQEKLKQEQEHNNLNQSLQQLSKNQNYPQSQQQQQHLESPSYHMHRSHDSENNYNRGRHSLGETPRDKERDSPVSPTRKTSVMKAYGIYEDSYENNPDSRPVSEQQRRSSQGDQRSHGDARSHGDSRSHGESRSHSDRKSYGDSRSHGERRSHGEPKQLSTLPEESSRSNQKGDSSQYRERGVNVHPQRDIPPEQDRRRRPYQAGYYDQDHGRHAYENVYQGQQPERHAQSRPAHHHHHSHSKSMQHPHRTDPQDTHLNATFPVSHGRSHSASSLQPGPAPLPSPQQSYPSQYEPKPLGQIAEVNESRGSEEFDRDHWKNHLDRMAKDLSKVPHERYRLKRTTSEQIRPIKEREKGGSVDSQKSTDSERERQNSDPNREPMRVSRGSDPTKESPREGSKIKRRESDRYDVSRKQRYMDIAEEKSSREKRYSEGSDSLRRPTNPKRRPMSGSVYIGGQQDPNRVRMSDPDQKVQVQQALLNFYEMKTGKRMDISSGSSSMSEENPLNFIRDRYGTLPPGWKDRTPSPGKRREHSEYDPLSKSMPVPRESPGQQRPQERPSSQRRTRSGEDPRQYRYERDMQQQQMRPDMLSPSSTSSATQQQQYRRQDSAERGDERGSRRSTSSSTASSHDRSSRSGERPGSLSLPGPEEKYPPRMAPLMPQYASVDQADRSDRGGERGGERGSDQSRGRPQEVSTSSSGGASPTKPTDLQRFTFTNPQAPSHQQNTSSSSLEDDKPPLPPRNYKPSGGDRRSQGPADPHWYPPHMDRRQDRIETRWGDGRQVQNYENLGQEDSYADQLRHQARKLSQSQSQPKLVSAPSYIHHGSGTRMNISTSRPVERPQVMNEAHQPKSAFRPVGTSSPKEELSQDSDRHQDIPQPQKRISTSHNYSNIDSSGRITEGGSHLRNNRTNGEPGLAPPAPPPKSYLSAESSGSPGLTPSSVGLQPTPDDVFSEDENRKFNFDRVPSSSRESSMRFPEPEPVKGEKPIPKPRQSQLRRRPSLNDGQPTPQSSSSQVSTAPPREEKIIKKSPTAVIRNNNSERDSYRNYERLSEATSSPPTSQQQVVRSPNSAFTSTVRYRNGTQESKDSGISDMEALSITARIAHLQQSRENTFRPIEKISPPKSNVAEISAKFGGSRDNLHLIGRESSPEANEDGDSSRNNSQQLSSAQRVNETTTPDRRLSSDRLLYQQQLMQQQKYEQEQQLRQQQWYNQHHASDNYDSQQVAAQDLGRHRPAELDLRQQQPRPGKGSDGEKRTIDDNNAAPVISHRRQVSQEELECDVEAQRLAKELREKDEQLSAVLAPSSEMKKTTDYMNGLFETGCVPTGNRRRGADGKSPQARSNTDEKENSLNSSDAKMSSPLPPTSPYWSSPETAKLENRMREEGISKDERLKDLCSDTNDLEKKKEELIDRMQKKLDVLKEEKEQLEEEIQQNNDLGKHVTAFVEQKCRQQSEIDKYKSYIDELVKIMQLLFKLSGRLARAENAVMSLDINADEKEKSVLEEKRDKLSKQHEDAKMLKEGIDRRSNQVAKFLKEYLSEEEFEDYQHFVDMKTKLTMDYHELEDKMKLAEEQLDALKRSMEKTHR